MVALKWKSTSYKLQRWQTEAESLVASADQVDINAQK